jgi:hypothetical protein
MNPMNYENVLTSEHCDGELRASLITHRASRF